MACLTVYSGQPPQNSSRPKENGWGTVLFLISAVFADTKHRFT